MSGDTRAEGKTDQLKGRIEEAYGDLTDDQRHKDKGQARQNRGKVKEAAGTVQDKFEDLKDRVDGA